MIALNASGLAAGLSLAIAMPAFCTSLDVLEFTAQVGGKALLVEAPAGGAATTVVFFADGVAAAQAGRGTWQGTWRGAGKELCYSFSAGPRAGSTCVELAGRGDGVYAASNGDVLRSVASALRF
ncbi:MAG: hypothetical protein AAFP13_00730 [Pseudomonadota bacterium]